MVVLVSHCFRTVSWGDLETIYLTTAKVTQLLSVITATFFLHKKIWTWWSALFLFLSGSQWERLTKTHNSTKTHLAIHTSETGKGCSECSWIISGAILSPSGMSGFMTDSPATFSVSNELSEPLNTGFGPGRSWYSKTHRRIRIVSGLGVAEIGDCTKSSFHIFRGRQNTPISLGTHVRIKLPKKF